MKALHRRRLACLLLFTAACVPVATMAAEPSSTTLDAPESVILLIGDGMGPQQVGLLLDWADAAGAGPTMLERFMKSATMGLLRTPMADSLLTDSAASATALACGVSTRLGAVGVDEAGNPVETCLEAARSAGRRTGLVTTTRVTHATPACFAAHLRSRNNEGQIARQMLAAGVDLLLGGGARFFLGGAGPGAQDLGEEIQAQGTRVVTTLAELDALTAAGGPILGLFAPSDIPYAIDRDEEGEADAPGLGAMIREAIKLLDGGGKGFFLMVEGGRIDHGCHANDAAATLGEMREFDEAVGIALEYRKLHP
ncbi:MAG: alkaline phosphatase, partial [Planctomycetota bacterium]